MGIRFPAVIFAILSVICVARSQSEEIFKNVTIPELGKIRGVLGVSSAGQTPYYTFHGIPYAEESSYTGENRFQPSKIRTTPYNNGEDEVLPGDIFVYCPQDAILDLGRDSKLSRKEAESRVFDFRQVFEASRKKKAENYKKFREYSSTEELKKAYLAEPLNTMGREECLTININTPDIPADPSDPEQLYPVVVFFHGGGSDGVWGSAFTALRMLEEHKVVLITMNYRLGILGALNLGIDEAPGNAGQYDAIVCLEWIQEYIKYFGGNKDRVIISGQSAGAMMVANLMLTPMVTKSRPKLFHGVWGFSGAAISVWAVPEYPALKHHLSAAEYAGCYNSSMGNDMKAVADCMRTVSCDTLVTALAMWKHQEEAAGRLGYDARVPSIQNPNLSHELYMVEHPYDILEKGEGLNVPLVLGSTRHDGSYPLDDIYNNFIVPSGLDKNETFLRNEIMSTLLGVLGTREETYNFYTRRIITGIKDDTGELYHAMSKTYLGESSLTGTLFDKLPGMMDMVTIMAFKAAEYDTLRMHTKFHTPNAYFYSLDYFGRWSLYNFLWGEQSMPGGVCHTDDLLYFFWLGPLMNDDMKVSRRWMNYFINFVKYGNPNGENVDPADEFWPRYNSLTHASISLNRTDRIIYNTPDHWIGPARELVWKDPTDTGTTTSTTEDPNTETTSTTKDPNTETTSSTTKDPNTETTTKNPDAGGGSKMEYAVHLISLTLFVTMLSSY